MCRLVLTLGAGLMLSLVAEAAVTRRAVTPASPVPRIGGATPSLPRQAQPPEPQRRLLMTTETEVQLDGQTCTFQQVPRNAIITYVELAADEQTILKLHFRSRR